MANWPSIATPSTLTDRTRKDQIKTDFAAGYVQSRPKWTRSRKIFDLSWKAMSTGDKTTLETFFENNVGDTFTWTYPDSGTTYTVRFSDDELSFKYVPVGHWQIDITLEEQ